MDNKPGKAAFLYTLTAIGWALFLGPQLEPYVGMAKQECLRLWSQWQGSNTPLSQAYAGYTTRIVSYDPFIMHIENFVSQKKGSTSFSLGKSHHHNTIARTACD